MPRSAWFSSDKEPQCVQETPEKWPKICAALAMQPQNQKMGRIYGRMAPNPIQPGVDKGT